MTVENENRLAELSDITYKGGYGKDTGKSEWAWFHLILPTESAQQAAGITLTYFEHYNLPPGPLAPRKHMRLIANEHNYDCAGKKRV